MNDLIPSTPDLFEAGILLILGVVILCCAVATATIAIIEFLKEHTDKEKKN